ncbi:MAG TPA: MarR family transcriptional regulator [Pseudolabrys sp.]|nr:MarR family transcriptional regulator [Pseudolabrys sp.]
MRSDKVTAVARAPEADERMQSGRSQYVLDEQTGFLMRVAMQRHTAIFMSRMVEGLTQTQFAALAKLKEAGPCSQNHLGRLIYLDAATIKGVVDRLRARGFVTAMSDPNDRRRRAVALSERGRTVTEEAIKVAAEITAATLAPLTSDEQQMVQKMLKKLG